MFLSLGGGGGGGGRVQTDGSAEELNEASAITSRYCRPGGSAISGDTMNAIILTDDRILSREYRPRGRELGVSEVGQWKVRQ